MVIPDGGCVPVSQLMIKRVVSRLYIRMYLCNCSLRLGRGMVRQPADVLVLGFGSSVYDENNVGYAKVKLQMPRFQKHTYNFHFKIGVCCLSRAEAAKICTEYCMHDDWRSNGGCASARLANMDDAMKTKNMQ